MPSKCGVISATEVHPRSLSITELVPAAVVARQRKEEKLRKLNQLRKSKRKRRKNVRHSVSLPSSFASSNRSVASVKSVPPSLDQVGSQSVPFGSDSLSSLNYCSSDDNNVHHRNDETSEDRECMSLQSVDLHYSSSMSDISSSCLGSWMDSSDEGKWPVLLSLMIDNHPLVLPMLRYCLPVSVGSLFGGCAAYVGHHSKNLAGVVVGACFVAAQCLQYHTSWLLNGFRPRSTMMITQSTSLSLLGGWSAMRNNGSGSRSSNGYLGGYSYRNYGSDSHDQFIEGLFAVGSFGAAFALAVYKYPIHNH